MTDVRHPAPWNRTALAAAGNRMRQIFGDDACPIQVLDPFAGIGRIHELPAGQFSTVGGELEPEWANLSDGTIVADALDFPAPDDEYDAVVTSPTWGNRMADHHEARDACKACDGTGVADMLDRVPCPKCKGGGLSHRNTYRHALGRMPTDGASSIMQFGPQYRRFHRDWIVEAIRLVHPGGLIIVNVANHLRKGVEVDVVGWWLGALVGEGLYVRAVDWIPAAKMRVGANADLRVDGEVNVVTQVRPS